MGFEAYTFRHHANDAATLVHARDAVVCTLEDALYECPSCACAVYLKLESVDNKRRHFAHGPNTSCEGSFDADASRKSNRAEERKDGRPGWFASLTTEICKPEACDVRLSKSIVADAVGVGGRPIFVQRAPLTLTEMEFRNAEVAKLGLPSPAWILQSTITSFRDISYGGDELKLVAVDCFDIGTCIDLEHLYVDGVGRGTLARVRAVGDGHVYKSRDGTVETVEMRYVLQNVFGEEALCVTLDRAVEVIARVQPLGGSPVAHDFVDWQAWMKAADSNVTETHRLDAHAAWVQIHRENGMRDGKTRAMKLLDGGAAPSSEQRAAISSIFGSRRTVLEGAAGTGKTVVARAVANSLERLGFRVACLGSTNRASIALMGKTLHSFCGVRKDAWLSPRMIKEAVEKMSEGALSEFRSYAAVILDEHAMLAPEYLSLLHAVLQHARGNQLPFGGCLVILIGNIDQLPPVCTVCDQKFCFDSPATATEVQRVAELNMRNTRLNQTEREKLQKLLEESKRPDNATPTEGVLDTFDCFLILRANHRQSEDCEFQNILAELSAAGRLGPNSRRILAGRVVEYTGATDPECARSVLQDAEVCTIMAYRTNTVKCINKELDNERTTFFDFEVVLSSSFKKYTPKRKADQEEVVSREEFDRLQAEAVCRSTEWMKDVVADRNAEYTTSTRAKYRFGHGARVLLLERCDDLPKHTVGTITGKNGDGTAVISVSGKAYSIKVATIEVPCNDTGSASITYMPLDHMAASTVHKSQGATIVGKAVIVMDVPGYHSQNAGRSWPFNLGYTALTRCKRLVDVKLMVNMGEVMKKREISTVDELLDQVFRIHPRVMAYKRRRGWVLP